MANKFWTDEDIRVLKEMMNAGYSNNDIAARLRRTPSSIRNKKSDVLHEGRLPVNESPEVSGEFSEAVYDFENAALKNEIKELAEKVQEYEKHIVAPQWDDEWDGDFEWTRAEKKSAKRIEKETLRGKFDVHFPSGPIAISVISDQHIAPGTACDFKRMREDAELIRDTPGFYAVFGGDGVDNHIKHRSALIGANSTPDEQWKLFDYYLQLFGDKILAIISGNHDA